jgi:hypothetical protein
VNDATSWDEVNKKFEHSPSYAVLPPITKLEDCLKFAQTAKDNGDKFVGAEDYSKAITEYSIAAQILGVPLWDINRMPVTREHVTLAVRVFVVAARLLSILKQSKSSLYLVDVALGWATCGYAGSTDFEKIELYIWKARLETEHAQLSSARLVLQGALQHCPNHDGIKTELENIKAKRLQAWKEDVEKQFPFRIAGTTIGADAKMS